jgi:thioredoxin-dependent peroxiredoxin
LGEIKIGEEAPDFDLPTDGGGRVRLSDLAGSVVVLYFYPKDDTPGCTTEAIAFSALAPEFQALSSYIVGISPDSVKSHDRFKAKHDLTIRLASDVEREVVNRYGVWVKKSRYGREYMGVERTTVLVGSDGRIAEIWRKVSVPGHAEAVLEAVRKQS